MLTKERISIYMKNKKSIYFLIFAIIIFIVMLLFFIYVQFFEETKNSFEKVEKQEIEVMNKMGEENIEEENKSITKDFEANYMDFMVFDKSGRFLSKNFLSNFNAHN